VQGFALVVPAFEALVRGALRGRQRSPNVGTMIAALPVLAGVLALTVGDAEVGRDVFDPPAPTGVASPCASAENHQFDFWIGEWDVTQPGGKAAGHNRITSLLGGCALREEWTGASGSRGTSLNAYDPASKRWRQTWVDDSGVVLLLEGQLQGGKMTLQGELPGAAGRASKQRITWSPQASGTVRQHWESSSDGGKTWKTEFDGTYRKGR